MAAFFDSKVNSSRYRQNELSVMMGFKTPNLITMIKQAQTKLPIDKIPRVAKALDVDKVKLFEMAMMEYKPDEYKAIIEVFGDPVSESEREVVNLLREILPESALENNTNFYLRKIREALGANAIN